MSLTFVADPIHGQRAVSAGVHPVNTRFAPPAEHVAESQSNFGRVAQAAVATIALTTLSSLGRLRRREKARRARVVRQFSAEAPAETQIDRTKTKELRRNLMKSDNYFKFGKTQMEKAMQQLRSISGSELVSELRANGYRLTIGDVTFALAESYGFCWGVERAVTMAYEARNFFADKTIWLTNEIIHNQSVNENLANMNMRFVEADDDGVKDFSVVQEGDVVILPAFGASIDEMAFLRDKGVQIVDATCPWVSKVWTSVEKTKDKGHTSIIHGKIEHEETIATKSFAQKYIVVKNMPEAEYVANYILEGGSREEFMAKFGSASSEGFDPDVDLVKVGVANQTTMLKGETELVGKLFERVMIKKFGPHAVNEHFIAFNTICDATQHRQDAMYDMLGAKYEAPKSALYEDLEGQQMDVELPSTKKGGKKLNSKKMEDDIKGKSRAVKKLDEKPDICVIVGGYNSSNTKQLLEIAQAEGVKGYHIDCSERIGRGNSPNSIEHKPLATTPADAMLDKNLETTETFLPSGPVTVALTSGASTPDNVLGEVMQKILEVKANSTKN